jgi:hypothetical protein
VELVPIGLHECRHTFVSLMHAAGRSLEEIGDYVGHTSTYMTGQYRHLLDGARRTTRTRSTRSSPGQVRNVDARRAGAQTGAHHGQTAPLSGNMRPGS